MKRKYGKKFTVYFAQLNSDEDQDPSFFITGPGLDTEYTADKDRFAERLERLLNAARP